VDVSVPLILRRGYRAHVWPEAGGFGWVLRGFRGAHGWEPTAELTRHALECAIDVAMEATT